MKDSTDRKIANQLRKLRKEHGITQKQLAAEVGLSYATIIGYENGKREPNSKAMAVLEKYFDVSGSYLRGETDNDPPMKWEDSDRIKAVNDEISQLLHSILDDAQAASDKDREQLFAFLPEVRHIIRLQDQAARDLGLSQLREASLSASRAADALQAALTSGSSVSHDK